MPLGGGEAHRPDRPGDRQEEDRYTDREQDVVALRGAVPGQPRVPGGREIALEQMGHAPRVVRAEGDDLGAGLIAKDAGLDLNPP